MAVFTVLMYDQFGDRIYGADLELTVTAMSEHGIVHCQITDTGNGAYQVQWQPIGRGTYRIDACVNGSPISRSPFASKIKLRGIDPAKCVVSGAVAKAAAGNMHDVVIKLRDEDGQPVESSADPSQAVNIRLLPPHSRAGLGHGTTIEVIFEGEGESGWTDQYRADFINDVGSVLQISPAQISLVACADESGASKPGVMLVVASTNFVLPPLFRLYGRFGFAIAL
jgi:hypothetical protein